MDSESENQYILNSLFLFVIKSIFIIVLICFLYNDVNGQPKIVIAKYKSSYKRTDKFLYEQIKGSTCLDSAFQRMVPYFIESNGDYFQLKCLKDCSPPFIIEFPVSSIKNRKSKDGFNTTLNSPLFNLNVACLDDASSTEYVANSLATYLSEVLLTKKITNVFLTQNSKSVFGNANYCNVWIKSEPKDNEHLVFNNGNNGNTGNEVRIAVTLIDSTKESNKIGEFNTIVKPASSDYTSGITDDAILDYLKHSSSEKMYKEQIDKIIDYLLKNKYIRSDSLFSIFPLTLSPFEPYPTVTLITSHINKNRFKKIKSTIESFQPVVSISYTTRHRYSVQLACSIDYLEDLLNNSVLGDNYIISSFSNYILLRKR